MEERERTERGDEVMVRVAWMVGGGSVYLVGVVVLRGVE